MSSLPEERWFIMEQALLGALRDANRRMRAIEQLRSEHRDDLAVAVRMREPELAKRLQGQLDYDSAQYGYAHRSWLEALQELQRLMSTRIVPREASAATDRLPSAGGTEPSGSGRPSGGTEADGTPAGSDYLGYYGDT